MSDTPKLAAQLRTEFGKGAARRTRRAGQIPAVLYGHGTDPVHLALPGHDTMMATKVDNAVLEIDFDGKTQLALVKDVQRDPIKGFLEHVDLIVVSRGEKVTVDVAVYPVGEASHDTLVNVEALTVTIIALATKIPESIEVSVEGLKAGTQILASDLVLPEGVEVDMDPETLVVNITAAITEEALEAELVEAEAGIEREESDEEAEESAEAETESQESSDSE
jgi:large subunit ribosomal protein L25